MYHITHFIETNRWGPHHWVVLVDMDCSQTQDGWFEFTTVYSLGKELQIFYKVKVKSLKLLSRQVVLIFYKCF